MTADQHENEVSFQYDSEADVLYVNLGTGEPSYSEPIAGNVIVDYGLYSRSATGFQILRAKRMGVETVLKDLKSIVPELVNRQNQAIGNVYQDRFNMLKQAIREFPNAVTTL